MKIEKNQCDSCGKEIDFQVVVFVHLPVHLPVGYHHRSCAEDDEGSTYTNAHFCHSCASTLIKFLGEKMAPPKPAPPAPPPPRIIKEGKKPK